MTNLHQYAARNQNYSHLVDQWLNVVGEFEGGLEKALTGNGNSPDSLSVRISKMLYEGANLMDTGMRGSYSSYYSQREVIIKAVQNLSDIQRRVVAERMTSESVF